MDALSFGNLPADFGPADVRQPQLLVGSRMDRIETVETCMDICIKGARAICEAVGENPKQIIYLVNQLGLPAWRRGGAGSWRALPEDLKRWMLEQRNNHLPPAEPRG